MAKLCLGCAGSIHGAVNEKGGRTTGTLETDELRPEAADTASI